MQEIGILWSYVNAERGDHYQKIARNLALYQNKDSSMCLCPHKTDNPALNSAMHLFNECAYKDFH